MSVDSYTEKSMKLKNNVIINANGNTGFDNINTKKSLLQERANKLYERQLELSFKKIDDIIIDQMFHKKKTVLLYETDKDYKSLNIIDINEFIDRLREYLKDEFEINYGTCAFSSSYIEINWE